MRYMEADHVVQDAGSRILPRELERRGDVLAQLGVHVWMVQVVMVLVVMMLMHLGSRRVLIKDRGQNIYEIGRPEVVLTWLAHRGERQWTVNLTVVGLEARYIVTDMLIHACRALLETVGRLKKHGRGLMLVIHLMVVLHVAIEIARGAERLAAVHDFAHLYWAAHVELHVLLELVVAWECAVAAVDWALQWLNRSVQPLVARKVARGAEALAAGAHRAHVGLLAGVSLGMFRERVFAVKLATAAGLRTHVHGRWHAVAFFLSVVGTRSTHRGHEQLGSLGVERIAHEKWFAAGIGSCAGSLGMWPKQQV